jgi:hypothetical protein
MVRPYSGIGRLSEAENTICVVRTPFIRHISEAEDTICVAQSDFGLIAYCIRYSQPRRGVLMLTPGKGSESRPWGSLPPSLVSHPCEGVDSPQGRVAADSIETLSAARADVDRCRNRSVHAFSG